jgi:serine/threonine protein kinase
MLRADAKNREEAWRREISIMKMIQHPNIIQFYDVVTHPDTKAPCIVMEYAANGELLSHINKNGPSTEPEASKLFKQLVLAVEYLHHMNIVHRDLKPENLLLGEDGRLKLTDFGLSAICTPNTLLHNACGTVLYCAAEVFSELPYDGRAADVWSMGVVLCVMLTGDTPWEGTNLEEQAENLIIGKFQLPPELSVECVDLITKMLVVLPPERATIADILQHPWMSKY